MKKILAFAAAGLLTVGFVGCNSKGASGSSEAMDSLSMAFGDLYGSGMGQQLRSMDSTINIEQALKGMEMIANADTSKNFQMGLQMGMQIAQLYQGIEQQCGMPINKSLFMKHLREALMKTTPMGQEDMMALQSKIEPLLNKAMDFPIMRGLLTYHITNYKHVGTALAVVFPVGLPLYLVGTRHQANLKREIKVAQRVCDEITQIITSDMNENN